MLFALYRLEQKRIEYPGPVAYTAHIELLKLRLELLEQSLNRGL